MHPCVSVRMCACLSVCLRVREPHAFVCGSGAARVWRHPPTPPLWTDPTVLGACTTEGAGWGGEADWGCREMVTMRRGQVEGGTAKDFFYRLSSYKEHCVYRYSLLSTIVQSATLAVLRFASRCLWQRMERSSTSSWTRWSALGEGVSDVEVRDSCVCFLGGLLFSCWTQAASASLRRCQGGERGRSTAVWSSPTLAKALERLRTGAKTGMGRDALQAQEVELEAEAEAVVMLGPLSVLLPSVSRNQEALVHRDINCLYSSFNGLTSMEKHTFCSYY